MFKIKNQNGFSLVEVLLVLILLSIIGGSFFYVKSQSDSDKPTSANTAGQKADTNTNPDPKADWKTFTDKKDEVSFKYPQDWKVDIEKISGSELGFDNSKGEFLSGTITSPSGKITLDYSNYVTGLGGGSCPDDFPCPTLDILAVKDLSGSKKVKYVEKITHWKGNGDGYRPSFGLISSDAAATHKVGQVAGENDFYLTANWASDGGMFAQSFSPNSDPEKGFKTKAEAQAFLDSAEAKIAKDILLSFTQK